MRVLLSSGGKDSFYALMVVGNVDMAIMLSYEFPRPSPHLINMGKSIETHLKASIPVLVKHLRKGCEKAETIEILRRLGVSEIIAGDVYIEDHLKYMEGVASEVGATLIEPLWGENPEDLLYKEIESGLEVLVIGCRSSLKQWLGVEINENNITNFVESCKTSGVDPLGEGGEYHTLVVNSPLHVERVGYQKASFESYEDYLIIRIL
uniref:ATPase n=1 Tax=Ignisphaera aggregans TaxID=334771 RepID=A0A7J3Z8X9_9CREN